jgi:hypothetical protein
VAARDLRDGPQQERSLEVLLLDECESGAGADRVPADASLSSKAAVTRQRVRVLRSRERWHDQGPPQLKRDHARWCREIDGA